MKIAVIILSFNESKHLARCLNSILKLNADVLVIDCYSSDDTVLIAESLGAKVLKRAWVSHADQFNWAVSQLDSSIDWIIRLDADEYMTPELVQSILFASAELGDNVAGVSFKRRMTFQGRLIKHGGVFPVEVVRMFRFGRGCVENRLMDEHIEVDGEVAFVNGELIDDNLNTLGWWIDKHNKYSSLEAVEILNSEYNFLVRGDTIKKNMGSASSFRRFLKEFVYLSFPTSLRSMLYFVYRYIFCLGFLDGRSGLSFHFLQGCWYRYLVDAKVAEVKRYARCHACSIHEAVVHVLGMRF